MFTRRAVLQVSDRLVTSTTGKVMNTLASKAVVFQAADVKVAALVRAKARGAGSAEAAQRATSPRGAIKRITDAYTWGAILGADYRNNCADSRISWSGLIPRPMSAA
jgi:hypothetical protein